MAEPAAEIAAEQDQSDGMDRDSTVTVTGTAVAPREVLSSPRSDRQEKAVTGCLE